MDSAFNSQEPTNFFGVAVAAAIFLWNTNNLFLWGVVPELIYWISRLATRGHFIEHLQHVVRQKRVQPDVVSSQSRRSEGFQLQRYTSVGTLVLPALKLAFTVSGSPLLLEVVLLANCRSKPSSIHLVSGQYRPIPSSSSSFKHFSNIVLIFG